MENVNRNHRERSDRLGRDNDNMVHGFTNRYRRQPDDPRYRPVHVRVGMGVPGARDGLRDQLLQERQRRSIRGSSLKTTRTQDTARNYLRRPV